MTQSNMFERAYTGVCRDAMISNCTRYRYWLKRWWSDDQDSPWACFIMLNPSTADAAKDDPTIRKCMGFAQRWGCKGIYVVNLFAYRATDPRQLLTPDNPIGAENAWAIRTASTLCKGPIVAAWGANKMVDRSGWVKQIDPIYKLGITVQCLGTTKDGYPKHPCYLPYETPLDDFVTGKAGGMTLNDFLNR